MLIESARSLADKDAVNRDLNISSDAIWSEFRFDDGWLLVTAKEGVLGAHHFVVTDKGEVHFEPGSMPPRWYAQKYSKVSSEPNLELVNDGVRRTPSIEEE